MQYVDVHTHLIHDQFRGEEDAAAERAAAATEILMAAYQSASSGDRVELPLPR